jgi:hypothetical protein
MNLERLHALGSIGEMLLGTLVHPVSGNGKPFVSIAA